MKRKLWKKIAASCIASLIIISGMFHREKKKMLSGKYITGLFFHNPSQKSFEKFILWLKKNNCIFISSEELSAILKGTANVPERAVWITFDDGWRDNMVEVVPIMIKYNIPITFFISTGPVEKSGIFWFSLVRKFRKHLSSNYRTDVKKLWYTEENIRREIVQKLEETLVGQDEKKLKLVREAMTIEDIKSLSQINLVTIGSHTVNHVITPRCTDIQLKEEIINSKKQLEKWTGKKVTCFSYPNGDFDGREQKIFKKCGITLAATTQKEFILFSNNQNLHFSNPYLIPRFCINDEAFFPEAVCQMVGAWGKLFGIFSRCKKLKELKKKNINSWSKND